MLAVRSLLYDLEGNEVSDAGLAVRGIVLEVGNDGTLRELDAWAVDPTALDGDDDY